MKALFAGPLMGLVLTGGPADKSEPEAQENRAPLTIVVRSVKPRQEGKDAGRARVVTYGLTFADCERLQTIKTVVKLVPMRIFPQEVRYLDRAHNGRLVATTADWIEVYKVPLAAGRFFSADDDRRRLNVAVLGAAVAERLFPFENPLGKTVRLGKHFYEVVGVLRERKPIQGDEDFNNDVYMPLRTSVVRFGQRVLVRPSGARNAEQIELHQITLVASDRATVRSTAEAVRKLLERHHPQKDWELRKSGKP